MIELKAQRGNDMAFLNLAHAIPKELCLREMLPELYRMQTLLHGNDFLGVVEVAALLWLGWWDHGFPVRPVVDGTPGYFVPELSVAVVVHDGTDGPVYRQLLPVDAEARELGIEVGEVPPLQERIIREPDTGNDMCCAEGSLFGLREVFVDILVELQLANVSDGKQFFRPDFRGVENVEVEFVLAALGTHLDAEFPGRVDAHVDRGVEVLAVEVRILASEFQSFVPDERMDPKCGREVEFDEVSLEAVVLGQCVGVDAEPLHHAI